VSLWFPQKIPHYETIRQIGQISPIRFGCCRIR
jgi:hypothetical protein